MTNEQLAAANLAERLLNDDTFKAVLKSVKNDVITEWAAANTVDVRERLHAELHAVGRLEARLSQLQGGLRIEAQEDRKAAAKARLKQQVENAARR